MFQGDPAPKVLHLHLDQRMGHFDVISAIIQFHNASHFCEYCNKGFDKLDDHCCAAICMDCHAQKPCKFIRWKFCSDCNRNFR